MSRKKITSAPLPPSGFNEEAIMCWFDVVLPLLEEDRLYEDMLPAIERLCRIEAQREGLIDELGLHVESSRGDSEPVTDFIHLVNPQAFDRRFAELLPKFKSSPEAYRQVEWEYRQTFGQNKYASYESYRVSRSGRLNKDS